MKDSLLLESDTLNTSSSTSIVITETPATTTTTVSIFKNHHLSTPYKNPESRFTSPDYFTFPLLLIVFFFFVRLFAFQRKILISTLSNFFQFSSNQAKLNEDKTTQKRVRLLLFLIFVSTLTVLIRSILAYLNISIFKEYLPDELIIAPVIIVLFFLKILIVELLGVVLKIKKETREYVTQSFLFINSLGLFLLPIVIFITFTEQFSPHIFTYIGIAIFSLLWVIRNIKGILLGLNTSKFSKIYLFIYLCTLEFLPLLLITKTLINVFG